MKPWQALSCRVLEWAFPSTDRLPPMDRQLLRDRVLLMCREAPFKMRVALYASALIFLLTPVLTIGRPLPATWLGPKLRERHGARLARHRVYILRQTVVMLKVVGGMIWGADPAVRSALQLRPYGEDPGTWRTS